MSRPAIVTVLQFDTSEWAEVIRAIPYGDQPGVYRLKFSRGACGEVEVNMDAIELREASRFFALLADKAEGKASS